MERTIKLIIIISIILCFGEGYCQYNWLNPLPNGNYNKKIVFIDDMNGCILNDREVVRTSDGGQTWQVVQDIWKGSDIDFFGNTGFVVTRIGKVYKSVNGGIEWEEIDVPEVVYSEPLNSVHVFSEDSIIISGENFIIKSFNSGSDWVKVWNEFDYITKTEFRSPLLGYATTYNFSSGQERFILKTIDGGLSWDTLYTKTNGAFIELYFYDDSVGFVSHRDNYILKTTDGGENWYPVWEGMYYGVESIYFSSSMVGYAVASYGVIYKTDDAGETWQECETKLISHDTPYSTFFLDDFTGYIVGGYGQIYKTTDAANSWEPHSFSYSVFYTMSFVNNYIGYASMQHELIKTIDGGINWEIIDVGLDNHTIINKLQFVTEDVGYWNERQYSNYDEFFVTTDGGQTKEKIEFGFEVSTIYSFFFLNQNVGYIDISFPNTSAGLFKTVDGGESWTKISSDYRRKKMKFLDNNIGFAIRELGNDKLFKTTDGGVNWTMILDDGYPTGITAFDFLNENYGIAGGPNSSIKKTTNGGESWESIANGTDLGPIDIKLYDEEVGYFISKDWFNDLGLIVKTENGGEDWDWSLIDGIDMFTCSNLRDDGSIIIGGTYGALLTNSDFTTFSDDTFVESRQLVFPNPTKESFRVTFDEINQIERVYIYSINGLLVAEYQYEQGVTIDVSGYEKGMYLLKIIFKNKEEVVKLIVH